jgi:DNA polymerase-1
MELCGMPMDPHKVQAAKQQLTDIVNGHMDFFRNNKHIKEVHFQLLQAKAQKKTEQAKQKVYTIDDSVVRKDLEEFNPNSDNQVRFLLYDYFGLPVIDLTDSKQPSTSGKTLKKMSNHTQDPEIIEILEHLQGNADAGIILSTFIPAFEKAQQLPDGSYRLYGNFNLGGTQSLRLSSSNPGKF